MIAAFGEIVDHAARHALDGQSALLSCGEDIGDHAALFRAFGDEQML